MGRRTSQDERQAIADALRAGRSVRDVASEFGRAISTVSGVAAENDILLDGSRTAAATARRTEDLRARLAEESHDALDDAQRIRRQLFGRWTLHNWYQGEHFEQEVDQPTAGDLRSLAVAYGILTDKALALRELGDLEERIAELEQAAAEAQEQRS